MRSSALPTPPWIVLFDIDGVLVDVRPSYHRVIGETVNLYLHHVLGLPVPTDLIGEAHVAALKRVGGFNNDWHTVAAILHVLVAHLPPAPPVTAATPEAVRQAAQAFKLDTNVLRRLRTAARHVLALEHPAREQGGGLAAIRRLVPDHNSHLVLFPPHLTPEANIIVRIYQERYLGPHLFQEIHGMSPRYWQKAGLIDAEVALVPVALVADLAAHFPLGLVTGRPRAEAVYALQRLGFWPYFRVLISHDEVAKEMARRRTDEPLGKPHPWPLQQAARKLDPTGRLPVVFLGDTVDDIRATVRLRSERTTVAVGCTWAYEDVHEAASHLRAAGADVIFTQPEELRRLKEGLLHPG